MIKHVRATTVKHAKEIRRIKGSLGQLGAHRGNINSSELIMRVRSQVLICAIAVAAAVVAGTALVVSKLHRSAVKADCTQRLSKSNHRHLIAKCVELGGPEPLVAHLQTEYDRKMGELRGRIELQRAERQLQREAGDAPLRKRSYVKCEHRRSNFGRATDVDCYTYEK